MNRRWKVASGLVVIFAVLYTGLVVAEPLSCETAGGQSDDGVQFEEVSGEVGFEYTGTRSGKRFSGAGVYTTDFNGDGRPDLFATGGSEPVLFENTGGEFVESDALPSIERDIEGAVVFDHDGDGRDDLLLLSTGRAPLLLDNGPEGFERRDVGFEEALPRPIGATVADYDGDGDLDLFVIQYGDWSENMPVGYRNSGPVYEDNGYRNVLYENTDEGFERATDAGIRGRHWSLATSFVDLTGDGKPDIHVADDFSRDVVYVNEGDGTFDRTYLGWATNRNAMSSEVADVDGDGRLDIFVTNIYYQQAEGSERDMNARGLQAKGNNLLINEGNGTFTDHAPRYNVVAGGWGWASVLTDMDNDIDDDLFHTTQTSRTTYGGSQGPGFLSYASSQIWERRNGTYESLEADRVGFNRTNARGATELDFDLDGDMDLVVAVQKGDYRLYENGHDRANALEVAVETAGEGTANGAELYVNTSTRTQYEVRNSKADYQSQDTRVAHFGLGDAEEATVRVVWPDGTDRRWNVQAGQRITVDQDGIQRQQALEPSDGQFTGILGALPGTARDCDSTDGHSPS